MFPLISGVLVLDTVTDDKRLCSKGRGAVTVCLSHVRGTKMSY